jgi:flagellar FliJ protein
MPNKLPLTTLIDLAQSKTDEATRRLGQLQSAHTSAAEKLDLLLQYRQDYLTQMQIQMQAGLTSAQLRNFQNFIGTLDGAIDQQRALTQQTDGRLMHGRTDWQACKRRLSSFDTLADRVRQQELQVLNRKDQRDSDERTARQFYLRSVQPNQDLLA